MVRRLFLNPDVPHLMEGSNIVIYGIHEYQELLCFLLVYVSAQRSEMF